jgi:hypothetical protein
MAFRLSMEGLSAVGQYFDLKVADWRSRDGSVAAHLRRLGRDGLVSELLADPDFGVVSQYLHRTSDVQYVHDAGYVGFKSRVRASVSIPGSFEAANERSAGAIVRASMLAAGVSPLGRSMVKLTGALPHG